MNAKPIVVVAVIVATVMPRTGTAASDQAPVAECVAIVTPAVQGVPGSAVEAAAGLRELISGYLTGPSRKVVLIEAKVRSQAAEEARQKGCEPLLFVSLTRKPGGGRGFMSALGQGANTMSWQLPGGGTVASAAGRAAASGSLQAAASMAQSTRAKDEVRLEYRLESSNGQTQFGPRTETRKATSDGEDLLTPVVARAAEAIVNRQAAK